MNTTKTPLARRIAVFAYGAASYAIFFATFLYFAGFIGNGARWSTA